MKKWTAAIIAYLVSWIVSFLVYRALPIDQDITGPLGAVRHRAL